MFPHDATLEFVYEDETRARVVARSVDREIGEIDDGRSETALAREGDTVALEVRARDVTALRAALNTWFSLIDVAERVADVGTRSRT